MKTLPEYIASSKVKRTQEEWGEVFGISRSYLSEILSGKVTPGTKVIARINEVTGGKVPPAVWFQSAKTESAA